MHLRRRISNRGILVGLLSVSYITALIVGYFLDQHWTNPPMRDLFYLRFPGEVAEGAILSLEAPFIMSLLVSAVGSLELKILRQVLILTTLLIITLSYVSTWVGILVALAIGPGSGLTVAPIGRSQVIPPKAKIEFEEPLLVQDSLMDVFWSMFPANVIDASITHVRTQLSRTFTDNVTIFSEIPWKRYEVTATKVEGKNRFGLAIFSIALGIAIKHLGPYGRPLLAFSHSFADAASQMATWVAWSMPIVAGIRSLFDFIRNDYTWYNSGVAIYCIVAVGIGALIHALLLLPGIYFAFVRDIPKKLLIRTASSLLIAFCTGSSVLAFPTTLTALEEADIYTRISRVVFPICILYNSNGSLIYTAVSAIFIKQLQNKSITFLDTFLLSIFTPIAVLDLGGVDEVLGVGEIKLLLPYIGVPDVAQATKVLSLEWFMHPVRESLNLLGGIIVCGIVNHYLRRELAQLPFFEDVLQEEVIRQRLKMWSGKEKELEETIIAEAEEDDGTNVSIAPGELPGRPEMNGMGVVIGSQLEISTTENDPKVGMEEKMKELPSLIGSFAESKKSKGSKKSKRSLKSKASEKSKKSAVSKKKKAAGAGAAAVEPSDAPNNKDTTTKSSEENKS